MVTDIFYPASDTDRLSDVLLAYLIQCEYYNCIPGRIIQIIRGTTRIEK